ncbi:MAG: hypothetical protein AABY40_00810 [Nanoarchaeota archaeon]
MNGKDFLLHVLNDGLYLELFCQRYKASLIDIVPDDEVYPPSGLIYVFDNQLGGFNIKGIKDSLDGIISESEWCR